MSPLPYMCDHIYGTWVPVAVWCLYSTNCYTLPYLTLPRGGESECGVVWLARCIGRTGWWTRSQFSTPAAAAAGEGLLTSRRQTSSTRSLNSPPSSSSVYRLQQCRLVHIARLSWTEPNRTELFIWDEMRWDEMNDVSITTYNSLYSNLSKSQITRHNGFRTQHTLLLQLLNPILSYAVITGSK